MRLIVASDGPLFCYGLSTALLQKNRDLLIQEVGTVAELKKQVSQPPEVDIIVFDQDCLGSEEYYNELVQQGHVCVVISRHYSGCCLISDSNRQGDPTWESLRAQFPVLGRLLCARSFLRTNVL